MRGKTSYNITGVNQESGTETGQNSLRRRQEAHRAAAEGRNPRHTVPDDMREQQGSWYYNRLETPVKMVGPGATGNVFRRCP